MFGVHTPMKAMGSGVGSDYPNQIKHVRKDCHANTHRDLKEGVWGWRDVVGEAALIHVAHVRGRGHGPWVHNRWKLTAKGTFLILSDFRTFNVQI